MTVKKSLARPESTDESEGTDEPDERIPWRPLLLLSAACALVICAISLALYPHGSAIVDERVYQQEAIALSEGHITLPSDFAPDHVPFFTAPNARGELMLKYPMLWPAVLAATSEITGSTRPAVGLVAFITVLGIGVLAWELTKRRTTALLSAALVALCPLFLVLTATQLAYGFSLGLVVWSGVFVLQASRDQSVRTWAAAGFVAGLGFFNRPYDLLLFLVPIAAWVLITRRPRMKPLVLGGLIGALIPLTLMLLSNWRITGSATTLPYSAVGPHDLPGYGPRLDTHTGVPYDFTFVKGLRTLGVGLVGMLRWAPLSLLGLIAAGLGWRRLPTRTWALCVSLVVVVPLGYLFFWGAWNGYVRLRTDLLVGPMYYLPVIVPLAIGAAELLRSLRPKVLGGVLLTGTLLSAGAVAPSVNRLIDARTLIEAEHADLEAMRAVAGRRDALLIVSDKWLLYRFPIFNRVALDGPLVGALDLPGRGAELLGRFPDRQAVRRESRYVFEGRPGVIQYSDGFGLHRQDVLTPIDLVSGTALNFQADLPGAATDASLTFQVGDRAWSWPVSGAAMSVSWSGGEPTVDGVTGHSLASPHVDLPAGLACVGRLASVSASADFDEICFDFTRIGRTVRVAAPGRPFTRFVFGTAKMLPSTISDRLEVTARG